MGQRQHLGNDGRVKQLVLAHLADQVVGHGLLLRRGDVDAAAVLRAAVVALTVQRGGVVDDKKDLQQLAGRHVGRVVDQLHHFIAAGGTGADVLIARPRGLAVAVAGFHIDHAADFLEHRFRAPEAAAAQDQG